MVGVWWVYGAWCLGFVVGGPSVGLQTTGYENTAMIHVTDWLPTLCEVAGCDGGGSPTGTLPLDGFSAWAAISTNGSTPRTEILHDTTESNYSPAIRVGDYKLLVSGLLIDSIDSLDQSW
jgi:arylsulfatase B/arylsulfatase I/J